MGRKLVDMSELEYSVVSTVVVAAVVHYTRLARVARGRNLSFDIGNLLVSHLCPYKFILTSGFYLLNGHIFAASVARIYLTHCASSKHINYT